MQSVSRSVAKPEQGAREPGVKVTKRPTKRRVSSKKNKSKNAKQFVTGDWTVSDIVARYPQATEVMAEYGLHCFGCAANTLESLEEGCLGHGFSEDDISDLVEDINELIRTTPPRPQELTITEAAARAIRGVAKAEKVEGHGLSVQADREGGFYMEFRKEPELGEKTFQHPKVLDVAVYASTLTLQRIGGATIDFREGKFKLDVGEKECCKKDGGECGCGATTRYTPSSSSGIRK